MATYPPRANVKYTPRGVVVLRKLGTLTVTWLREGTPLGGGAPSPSTDTDLRIGVLRGFEC